MWRTAISGQRHNHFIHIAENRRIRSAVVPFCAVLMYSTYVHNNIFSAAILHMYICITHSDGYAPT